jgi:branched-chain amino acid transport system substrate-binding protein
MKRLHLAVLAVLFAAACSAPLAPAQESDEIAIASDFPSSGQSAAAIAPLVAGVRFAVSQQPRVGRYRVVYLPFDDSLSGVAEPIKGDQNVSRMIADPRVLGMVGPYNSFVASDELPLAAEGHLAIVSPTTTFDCLTLPAGCAGSPSPPAARTFFRIAARDSSQGTAMAQLVVGQLGLKRLAILHDGLPIGYGDSLAAAFANEVQALGARVVLNEVYNLTASDFTDQLSRAAAAGAQAVYVGGSPSSGATCRIPAQMRGIFPSTAYFLGGDSLAVGRCIADAGLEASERMLATVPVPRADVSDPRAIAYLKAHHGLKVVDPYTFAAYDCALVEIDAIKRAVAANGGRKPSRDQIVRAIAATQDLKGITGAWSFDANGDATAPGMSFYRVENGKWVLWKAGNVGGDFT